MVLLSFVFCFHLSEQSYHLEYINAILGLVFPTLLHDIYQLAVDVTSISISWIDVGGFSFDELFMNDDVVFVLIEYPQTGQQGIMLFPKVKISILSSRSLAANSSGARYCKLYHC